MKHIHVSAAVLYRIGADGQKEIFATERGYGDWKGWWEFPGGKIEHDAAGNEIETPEEALVREIHEELDSTVQVEEKIATVDWDYPATANSPAFHLTMECFACKLLQGKLTLLEAKDSRWLTKESVYSVNWLPADRVVLDKLSW